MVGLQLMGVRSHPFIAITSTYTLAQSRSTWQGLINRFIDILGNYFYSIGSHAEKNKQTKTK